MALVALFAMELCKAVTAIASSLWTMDRLFVNKQADNNNKKPTRSAAFTQKRRPERPVLLIVEGLNCLPVTVDIGNT